jgi:zinc transporter ZupT
MALNYKYIPWLSLLGIIGAAIGYVVGGGSSGPQAMYLAMVGLLIGTIAGMVVRIVLRYREPPSTESDKTQDTDKPDNEKT